MLLGQDFLNMKRKTSLAIALTALLLLTSGCVNDNKLKELRFACLRLSTYSAQDIPACDNPESCYGQVEKNFSFWEDEVSYPTSGNLHEYKNHLARSWLFYNKARESISRLNEICGKENLDASAAKNAFDDFREGIVNAFREIEMADNKSFDTISSMKNTLDDEGIMLMKEEPLFNDYLVLAGNEAVLRGQQSSGGAYAERFFSESERMDELSKELGFDERILSDDLRTQTYSAMKLAIPFSPETSKYKAMAVFADLLFSLLEKGSKVENLNIAMKESSAFEFFNVYNGFAGTINSLPREFESIIKSNALHRKELNERISMLDKEITENLSSAETLLTALENKEYERIDSNFLTNLYSITESENTITTNGNGFDDIVLAKENAKMEIFSLRSKHSKAMENLQLGNEQLGKTASSLKDLYAKSVSLKSNLEYLSAEIISNIDSVCEERLRFMRGKISDDKSDSGEILSLKAALEYRIEYFLAKTDVPKRLALCSEGVELYQNYSSANANLEEYILSQKTRLNECLSLLGRFFTENRDYEGNLAMRSAKQRFMLLKEMAESEEQDYTYLSGTCEEIKGDIIAESRESPELKGIMENHAKAGSLAEMLGKIKDNKAKDLLAEFEEQKRKLENPEGILLAGESLAEIEKSSQELCRRMLEEAGVEFTEYLADSARLQIMSSAIPRINKEQESRLKLTIENRLATWASPLKIELKQILSSAGDSAKIVYQDKQVSKAAFTGKDIKIELDSVPLGSFSIVFDLNSIPAASTSERKIMHASSEKIVFEETIAIKANYETERLSGEIDTSNLSIEPSGIAVYAHGVKTGFSLDSNRILFTIEKPREKDILLAYYSAANPIDVSMELKNSQEDGNFAHYTYKARVKNRLGIMIDDAEIILPFAKVAGETAAIRIVDEYSREVKAKEISGENISFGINGLSPKETRDFTIDISTNNYSSYWKKQIEKTVYSLLLAAENKEGAMKLSASLKEFLSKDLTGKNISELTSLLSDAGRLIAKEESSQKSSAEYLDSKKSLDAKIAQLAGMSEFLKGNKFDKEYFEAQKALKSARDFSAKAVESASKEKYSEAIGFVHNALAVIADNEKALKSAGDFLLEKWTIAKKNLSEKKKLLSGADSKEALDFEKHSLELDENFNNSLADGNFNEAAKAVNAMDELAREADSLAEKQVKEKCAKLKEALLKAGQDNLKAEGILFSLEGNMNALPNGSFEKMSYIPPFTEDDITGYRAKISAERRKISTLQSSWEKKENCAGVNAKEENEIVSLQGETAKTRETVEKKLSSLERDAKTIYSTAEAKQKNSGENPEAESLLSQAENAKAAGEFTKSIAYSKAAIEKLSFNGAGTGLVSAGNFPYAALILIPIIAATAYFKYLRKEAVQKPVKIMKNMD